VVHDVVADEKTLGWIESSDADSNGFYHTSKLLARPFTEQADTTAPAEVVRNICPAGHRGASLSDGI
jgi:hypothetical protein